MKVKKDLNYMKDSGFAVSDILHICWPIVGFIRSGETCAMCNDCACTPASHQKKWERKAHMSRSVWKYSLSKHAACQEINGCCPKWSPIRVKAVGNSFYAFLLTVVPPFKNNLVLSFRFMKVQYMSDLRAGKCWINCVIWFSLVLMCHQIEYILVEG